MKAKTWIVSGCMMGMIGCASADKKADEPITDQPAAAEVKNVEGLGPAATKWANTPQPAAGIEFFKGTFDKLGIQLDTGEEFTVVHTGTAFEFEPGIAKDADFIVPLTMQNIDNVIEYGKDGEVGPEEATKVMAVVFTPLTQEVLKHPVTADDNLRKLSGVEDHIHTYLIGPNGEEVASHTLIYTKEKKWVVTKGITGTPSRIFRISASDAVDYQRHAFTAIKKNNMVGWTEFATWYKAWRDDVSEVPPKG